MFIKIGKEFADGDFNFLKRYLEILDNELDQITSSIRNSSDPVSDGLCDYGEYIIGQGFVAVQLYINRTWPYSNLDKNVAIFESEPKMHDISIAKIINAGANYCKHQEEWDICSVIAKDTMGLSSLARKTIETIESITPWADYTLSNLLAELLKLEGSNNLNNMKLSQLLDYVVEWRNNVALKT